MQVPLIDTYIDRLTPTFRDAGNSCRAFAERIIARLESIESSIRESEFQEFREITRANLTVAGGLQTLEEIPPGVDWELQFITIVGTANVTITDGVGTVLGYSTATANPQTFDSYGFIARGGSLLSTVTSGNCTLYAQWKVRAPKKAHRGYIGGIQQPIPDGTGDYGGPGRHAAISHIVGANYPE